MHLNFQVKQGKGELISKSVSNPLSLGQGLRLDSESMIQRLRLVLSDILT